MPPPKRHLANLERSGYTLCIRIIDKNMAMIVDPFVEKPSTNCCTRCLKAYFRLNPGQSGGVRQNDSPDLARLNAILEGV